MTKRSALMIAGLALVALAAAAAAPAVVHFFRVDSCYDRGGFWDHEADACVP